MKELDFLTKVLGMIHRNGLIENTQQPVLVAVSGGADSVALLRALNALEFNCLVAHCNFHLRGEESDRDEAFVRQLCDSLKVHYLIKDFDVPAYQQEHGVSLEMACRELRYDWFENMRIEHQCQCIAVAHHRDDSIETFFLNIFRGTGIAGLTGIKPRNGHVVRPLLDVTRHEVVQYLKDLNQDYVTDSTNLENDALRNRVRNEILPAIDKMFPNARTQLQLTMSHTSEYLKLLNDFINKLTKESHENNPTAESLSIPYSIIQDFEQKGLLLYEIARPYGFNRTQCDQAIKGYQSQRSGYYYSDTHYMRIHGGVISINPLTVTDNVQYPLDFSDMSQLPVKLHMQIVTDTLFHPAQVNGSTSVAFDASVLQCSQVVLRRWREGDSMIPFGMRGRKLLSDLFTDFKLDREQKKNVWILEADGEIVWVLGLRAANAFKVKNTSQSYILLTCNQGE